MTFRYPLQTTKRDSEESPTTHPLLHPFHEELPCVFGTEESSQPG